MKQSLQYKEVLTEDLHESKGIDYDTRMRYVDKQGMRFWEHGEVHIKAGMRRNPKGRMHVSCALGASVDLLSDIGYKLFTPDGAPVTKTQLRDKPVLLRDYEHNVVVDVSGRNSVVYKSADSIPVPKHTIAVYTTNAVAMKELWPEIEKWSNWVRVMKRMGIAPPKRPFVYTYTETLDAPLNAWMKTPIEPAGYILSLLWFRHDLASLKNIFTKDTAIKNEHPYLRAKIDSNTL